MSPHLSPQLRVTEAPWFEGSVPDMIEVVRVAPRSGRGPALVVSQRKLSGSLLAQLRQLANEPDAG